MNATESPSSEPSIDSVIQQGWADHVDHTEAVAQRLAQRSTADIPAEQLARFVGLLVHVYGEHLGRCDEGIGLLRAMAARPTQSQVDGVLPRGMAALGLAAGRADAAASLSAEDRLAARATAASILNGQRLTSAALAMLRAALADSEALPLPDSSPAVRALAVAGNNIAADLQDLPQRSAEQDEAMLLAAQVGLDFWRRCGGWLEHERAEYRFARSCLRAGRAAEGLAHARSCLAICEASAAPAFERFFGHALAAICAAAAGDDAAFIEHNEQALLSWANVPPDELSGCQDDLAELRRAAGESHQGRCPCGQVRYRLRSGPLFVHACHCRWCQRESGTAFATNALIETDRVQLLAGEPELIKTPSHSGNGQTIARCPRCRIALWSHYAGSGEAVAFVRVGTLLDPDRLPPDIHIFTSTRQPWLNLPEGVPAVPEYYDRETHWPAASLERRKALLNTQA